MSPSTTLRATRLLDEPIIRPHMDARMGDNINGPALVRMPDWVEGRLGRYYLYFSDHKGKYIRLAYADHLTGPWTMHTSGVLDLGDSHFPAGDLPMPPPEDQPEWAPKMQGGFLYTHIASPDVHIDDEAQVIRMYYHGLLWNGDQATRLAVSRDGLSFDAFEPMLGPPYFRAFQYGGFIYAIAWGGGLWRAPDWGVAFAMGPQLVPFDAKEGVGEGFRHGETHLVGDTLHLFYHRMGDRPESILHATVDLAGDWAGDWMDWTASEPAVLLAPELPWEGGDLPLTTSVMGGVDGPVRELRDPCVFVDKDGSAYLLYCGAGESGIGIARLEGLAA